MSWTKIVFDHDVITSQFLNDLQDYIMGLEERIEELEARPQLIPYQEERGSQLPTEYGSTDNLTLQAGLINKPVVVGDVLVGTDNAVLAEVTDTDGQFADVVGLGERLGTGY